MRASSGESSERQRRAAVEREPVGTRWCVSLLSGGLAVPRRLMASARRRVVDTVGPRHKIEVGSGRVP
eukprot:1744428-Pyramimonas_sp.AAC.1